MNKTEFDKQLNKLIVSATPKVSKGTENLGYQYLTLQRQNQTWDFPLNPNTVAVSQTWV